MTEASSTGTNHHFVPMLLNDEKLENVEQDTITNEEGLLSVPWENDNFSLNLDSTFSSTQHMLKRLTKQYVPPQTSSPLRHQWRASQDNPHMSKLIEFDVNKDQSQEEKEDVQQSTKPKVLTKRHIPDITIDTDAFPYNNSSHIFTNSGSVKEGSLKSPTPSISSSSRNRVEYISPLINNPILKFDDIKSTSSSSFHTSTAKQEPESWKIRKSSPYGQYTPDLYNNDAPSIASSHNDPYRTSSPPLDPERYSTRSISPSIASSSSYKQSYRRIATPQNADNLVIYSSETNSIYTSGTTQQQHRPYSHYFHPNFAHVQPKKRSPTLLRKLMNNIKHRFIATK